MNLMDEFKARLAGTKVGFEGVRIDVKKHPEQSALLVEASALGTVDFPGDSIENVIAKGFELVKSGAVGNSLNSPAG